MRGLYAIVDTVVLGERQIDPLLFAAALLSARPAALQLRAKNLPARETLALLRALSGMCRRAKVPLVANDRADLAALAGCDLVHIGQNDLPIAVVRQLAPRVGVGLSTHSLEQLVRALELAPTYVAFGPVYATHTKEDAEPVVGPAELRRAWELARAAGVPLVAIGGIDLERAEEVASCAPMAAIIRGLVPDGSLVGDFSAVTARAHAFDGVLRRGVAADLPS